MGVTMRYRNRDSWYARQRTLDRVCIRAPSSTGLAELIRYPLRFSRLLKKANQSRVVKRRAIGNVDCGTKPKLCVVADIFATLVQREIIGRSRVYSNG